MLKNGKQVSLRETSKESFAKNLCHSCLAVLEPERIA